MDKYQLGSAKTLLVEGTAQVLSVNNTKFQLYRLSDGYFATSHQCTHLLVNTINKAKKSIYVQAYSFTAYAIAKALVQFICKRWPALLILPVPKQFVP